MERVKMTHQLVGICRMQICAVTDATDEEILAVCNRENPSGTRNGWCEVVRDGDGSPVECAVDPGRVHLMAVC